MADSPSEVLAGSQARCGERCHAHGGAVFCSAECVRRNLKGASRALGSRCGLAGHDLSAYSSHPSGVGVTGMDPAFELVELG